MTTLAELNVTPMLDLAFVLLIIFMITAPLLASRVDLIIPTTKAKREAVSPENTLIVEMNNEGDIEIEGAMLSQELLGDRIDRAKEQSPEVGVLIKADEKLTLLQIMPILDLLKKRGIVDVGFTVKSLPD